jgi:hypothetical protein
VSVSIVVVIARANRKYTFDKIIAFLEVPLDNKNAKKLKKKALEFTCTLSVKSTSTLFSSVVC